METERNGKKRVVVTGLGAYTCLGHTPEQMWQNLLAGRSGVSRISIFDASDFPITIAGEVPDFDPVAINGPEWAGRAERYIQVGLAAAVQAVNNAGLDIENGDLRDAGVVVSNAHGQWDCMPDVTRQWIAEGTYEYGNGPRLWKDARTYYEKKLGPAAFNPGLTILMNYDMPTSFISERLGANGPRFTVSSACVSGAKSIERAVRMIRHNQADIVVTGGSESDVTEYSIWFLDAMQALTSHCDIPEQASQPFDKNRSGFVMAEAGAILILESLEHALKRDADILAEVVGVGGSANAYSLYAPEPIGEGPAGAMEAALRDAGMNYDEIDSVFAHATATEVGDPAEAGGIKMVLRDKATSVPVTATKSMMGHSIGAAGAVGAIQCIYAVRTGTIPHTVNLVDLDESCEGIFIVRDEPYEGDVKTAANNAFGFGGANATNIFQRFTG
ncbi:MAG: beta-ketoacyl-[acyl-carrier-protein] synthase family protein [Planctomycetes bacterium]|nr:beta-ketoacyl-[acyl-carrier-protein] synthase family protein [Planctomycetota bacterium]